MKNLSKHAYAKVFIKAQMIEPIQGDEENLL